ncbi:MAG TPA: YggS family pyridoxal phosphate-dependent enzyme [Treponemataceae bacterium]|nr:YggS family pyridoxal phosphate-dependent enzyme [Treponemataceae bacterium]
MSIAENLDRVRSSIQKAALACGRNPSSIELVAVSKFHSIDEIMQAVSCGQKIFGENRVQESLEKFPSILESNSEISLHLIGNLQRNKVKKILPFVSCIESVDRSEILEEIGKESNRIQKHVSILFEFHTGEESKAGFQTRDSLFSAIDLLEKYPFLTVKGLMTMAPFTSDTSRVRSSFKSLSQLQRDCISRYPMLDFSCLSMGMSSDFEIAIEEGSTEIRIGTAIFGERQQ